MMISFSRFAGVGGGAALYALLYFLRMRRNYVSGRFDVLLMITLSTWRRLRDKPACIRAHGADAAMISAFPAADVCLSSRQPTLFAANAVC